MKPEITKYLSACSPVPRDVDRLIASSFIHSLNLNHSHSSFLKPFVIQEDDPDYEDLQEFLSIFTFTEIEELIQVFEFVLSPKDKIVTGAVYTPKDIRDYIVKQCLDTISDLTNVKIFDPACGCGGFLYTAAKAIHDRTGKDYKHIFSENIFGIDIQAYAIDRSKLLLTLLAFTEGESTDFQFNLEIGDALNFKWTGKLRDSQGFDVVVGNPPYVCSRNIQESSKRFIFDWKVSETGHPDLYIPFFQIGIENLRPNGVLGFITMNTFFRSVNGRSLRQYFDDESLKLRILDFGGGQVFQSKSTYTCICIIQRQESSELEYAKVTKEALANVIKFQHISYSNLNHKTGWNLQHHELLNKIEETGIAFGKLYRTRNGIATLKNSIYIFNEVYKDKNYFYLRNGEIYPIEKGVCKEIINPNKLTRSKSIDELRQKAIFPYEFNDSGDAKLIAKDDFRERYPKAFEYLKAKQDILATRDKGNGKYEDWYAYGRNQSLEKYSSKLFFPHITPHIPHYTVSNDEELLFYNGIAVVNEDKRELHFLQKLMSSNLFWFYVVHSSKPYGSGYFSLSRNYIKGFGVYGFNEKEKDYIIEENDPEKLNDFIETAYGIEIPE